MILIDIVYLFAMDEILKRLDELERRIKHIEAILRYQVRKAK